MLDRINRIDRIKLEEVHGARHTTNGVGQMIEYGFIPCTLHPAPCTILLHPYPVNPVNPVELCFKYSFVWREKPNRYQRGALE